MPATISEHIPIPLDVRIIHDHIALRILEIHDELASREALPSSSILLQYISFLREIAHTVHYNVLS